MPLYIHTLTHIILSPNQRWKLAVMYSPKNHWLKTPSSVKIGRVGWNTGQGSCSRLHSQTTSQLDEFVEVAKVGSLLLCEHQTQHTERTETHKSLLSSISDCWLRGSLRRRNVSDDGIQTRQGFRNRGTINRWITGGQNKLRTSPSYFCRRKRWLVWSRMGTNDERDRFFRKRCGRPTWLCKYCSGWSGLSRQVIRCGCPLSDRRSSCRAENENGELVAKDEYIDLMMKDPMNSAEGNFLLDGILKELTYRTSKQCYSGQRDCLARDYSFRTGEMVNL